MKKEHGMILRNFYQLYCRDDGLIEVLKLTSLFELDYLPKRFVRTKAGLIHCFEHEIHAKEALNKWFEEEKIAPEWRDSQKEDFDFLIKD